MLELFGKIDNVQSFSTWFGKWVACPTSLSENFIYIHTSINNVFKRNNVKSVVLYLVARNNVIDYASQNYMVFTDQLIGLGHWSNNRPTSHPRIFFEQKENLNLLTGGSVG